MTPLYFETTRQGATFLTLCAAGFLAAMALDAICAVPAPWLRPVRDVLMMLGMGVFFLSTLAFTRDDQLRGYHPLAFLLGCILYACGLRRVFCALLRAMRTLRKKFLCRRRCGRKTALDVEEKNI